MLACMTSMWAIVVVEFVKFLLQIDILYIGEIAPEAMIHGEQRSFSDFLRLIRL